MSEKNSTNGKKESPRSTSGDETKSGSSTSRSQSSSPRRKSSSPRRSVNKIYRTPPTPEPEVLYEKEKSFVLDCIAMYTTSNDYARAQPKLGQVVPPYNSQKDNSVKEYFKFIGVDKTLGKTGQVRESYSVSMCACLCVTRDIGVVLQNPFWIWYLHNTAGYHTTC